MYANRRHFLPILLVGCALLLRADLPAAEHTKDSLDDVKQNLRDKKAVLVDVREQAEWDDGHLEGARLVPLSELKQGKQADSLPKDRIVYAHCASGKRCLAAADILKQHGYDVRPLKAGYLELVKAGFKKAGE
jgi:rhodanese-related sulfurtransferase